MDIRNTETKIKNKVCQRLTRYREASLQFECRSILSRINQPAAPHQKLSEGVSLTLNIAYHTDLIFCDEIDGDSFPPKATAASNSMHIHLLLLWKVVIDDDGDLLNIDAAGQHVSGDQDPRRARPKAL